MKLPNGIIQFLGGFLGGYRRTLKFILLVAVLAGGMILINKVASPEPANGDGGNVVSPSEIVVVVADVEMQVWNPLKVYTDGFTLHFAYNGEPVKIWPGQEVATGYVTVENISSIPYSPEFLAVPLSPEAYIQPPFSVTLDNLWDGRLEAPWDGKVLQPGQKVMVYIRVSLPYWAEASMPFRGLKLLVKPQPPAPVLPGESG